MMALIYMLLMLIMCCENTAAAAVAAEGTESCSRPAELLFLVDTSRSIRAPDFRRELQFVRDMIGRFDVSPTTTRVAVVTFSEGYREEFDLDGYDTAEEMQEAVLNVNFTMGFTTDTDAGLHYARDLLLRQSRPDVTRIIICITDGGSTMHSKTVVEAEKTREADILVFAIGVGPKVNYEELGLIATENSQEFVHTAEDFSSLSSLGLLLAHGACSATVAPTTAPTTTTPPTTTTTTTTPTTPTTTTTTTTTPAPTTTTTTPTTTTPTTTTTTTSAPSTTKTSLPTTTKPPHAAPTVPSELPMNDEEHAKEECWKKPADIVFVLDRSSSVYVLDFQALLSSVQDIVWVMDIAPDKTQIAAVSFSTNVTVEFLLDDFRTQADVMGRIGSIQYTGGTTETGQALSTVHDVVLSPERGARGPEVPKVVIVITDGLSQNTLFTKAAAARLKEEGVYTFAVGVGKAADRQELEDIASTPYDHYLFEVGNYAALNTVEYMLATRACQCV